MWTIGEFKTNMGIVLHIRELFCVKWTTKKQRKRGETFFYTFCTISFLFPPLRPLSTECAEYAFHGQEALERARTENREKRHKAGEKQREREREIFLLSLVLQYRKMDLLPRKPHWFLFFSLSWSSRNTELPLWPELDRAAVTHSDAGGGGGREKIRKCS